MSNKKQEVALVSPESLEIANAYLMYGNIKAVSDFLGVSEYVVTTHLDTAEVKRYIDTVFLDQGYRNRSNIASALDEMIKSKLEEAEETGMYTSKDLADLLQMAHKMRMDEIKATQTNSSTQVRNQTNIQVNNGPEAFGGGNYGSLMDKLLNGESK